MEIAIELAGEELPFDSIRRSGRDRAFPLDAG